MKEEIKKLKELLKKNDTPESIKASIKKRLNILKKDKIVRK